LIVAALIAVNAVGDVLDERGDILAGVRQPPEGKTFVGALNLLKQAPRPPASSNTVIGVVATNARLTRDGAAKVAQMAHDGLARAVNPAHTMVDGDTLFSLASGEIPADVSLVGAFAAEAVAQAVRNGTRAATTLAGVRAWND
jgi:L-aminopeptidase/D-esterase-like protein